MYPSDNPLTSQIDLSVRQLFESRDLDYRELLLLEDRIPSVLDALVEVGIPRALFYESVYSKINYEGCLVEDRALRSILDSLQVPKFVVSIAPMSHIRSVLERLGVTEYIEGSYSMEAESSTSKGDVYEVIIAEVGVPPASVLIVGDNPCVDLKPGADLGCVTICVCSSPIAFAMPNISSIHQISNLIRILPDWTPGQANI
jgi:FMN phosphatase YigB (HAD superfamily)